MKIKTIEQIQEINKLYDGGLNLKQLAERFDVSSMTIRNYVWNPRGLNVENIKEKYKKLKEDGKTDKYIAKLYGVNKRTVWFYKKKGLI